MRLMALDLGEKNIGVAVSDELEIVASPRETLRRDGSELDRIDEWVRREEIGEVVVGLPLSLDGSVGPAAQQVLEWVTGLRARLPVPVETWDERLTTAEAEKMLIASETRRSKRRRVVDQIAATLILQSYMRRRSLSRPSGGASGGSADW